MFEGCNGLTLDVVCDFHGDVGVVQSLSELADVDLSLLNAVARVALRVALAALRVALALRVSLALALRVALALCVALDVTRLSTVSFLAPWSLRPWRPRRPGDGARSAVA